VATQLDHVVVVAVSKCAVVVGMWWLVGGAFVAGKGVVPPLRGLVLF
jgi:hypothetical protein